jgi:arylsulfatase A-like enzyme
MVAGPFFSPVIIESIVPPEKDPDLFVGQLVKLRRIVNPPGRTASPPQDVILPHIGILRCLILAAVACSIGCRSSAPSAKAPGETTWGIYRFDDHFSSAVVSAPGASSAVGMAEPLRWDFNEPKTAWRLVRGRGGFRPGELVLKGEEGTAVIQAPLEPQIDWTHYEAMRIRMIAEGGKEIKVRLGNQELKQPLGPAREYRVYRFDLKPDKTSYTSTLAIMPTDDLSAAVGIDFIELIPRKETLASPAGLTAIGKGDEYRNTIFAHAPASISYEVAVAKRPVLHFGMGASGTAPVVFRVFAGPSKTALFSKTLGNQEAWEDVEVDLAAYAGTTTRFVFETESSAPDAVGFWANPLIASTAPKSRPNILMYVVCTLRPDHTGVYGYRRDTTPFLKQLGDSGVVFDDAVSQAPWTKPSVASILTSLYSYTHGINDLTETIPQGAVTLAQRLRAAGYVTASVVASPFGGRQSGLDRGFDYAVEMPAVERHAEAADRDTNSAAINRAIVPWLDHHRNEPMFLFVLATDPHAPYRAPAEFERLFANPAETPEFDRQFETMWGVRQYGGGAAVTPADMREAGIEPDGFMRRAVERYDAKIRHNDKQIENLVGKFKQLGVLDNTLVVVSSDHGEEFWEHGFGAHGHTLYQELVHAVLLFWNPRLLPKPRRVAEPVQLMDVMPTILEMSGATIPPTAEGQSLVPLLHGERFTRTTEMVSTKFAVPTAKPGGGLPSNLTDTFARFEPGWKLIYRAQAARARMKEIELYDRRADPLDRNDVSAGHPEVVSKMRSGIDRWLGVQQQVKLKLGAAGSRPLDARTIERLRSLGYLAGK